MLPLVLFESLVRPFNFYRNGSVRQGMSYGQHLYRLSDSYGFGSRLAAYTLGCRLADLGNQVIITVSGDFYKVWIELRGNLETLQLGSDSTDPEPQNGYTQASAISIQVLERSHERSAIG